MLTPDLEDVIAISALMLGLGIVLDVMDARKRLRAAIDALFRRRADRRSSFARQRWPQPLSDLEGSLMGWGMNGAAAPLISDRIKRRGLKRWLGLGK